jgi:tetratricopeptide (TPR) repeat protein/KaiC/GvpD/RAD55 family RecA-like ATPase
VSESQNLESLLVQAKEQEEKYEWLVAVGLHKKAMNIALGLKDFLRAGEIEAHIGFCYHRATFQAESSELFEELNHLTVESYDKASKLFDEAKLAEKEKLAKSNHCKALSVYASVESAADTSKKKMLLDECIGMTKKALKAYEEVGDRIGYAKACIDLLESLFDRIILEGDWEARKRTAWEAIDYGEKAIPMLLEIGHDWELARAYLMTGLHYGSAAHFSELKEKWKELGEKSLSYSRKAVELAEKAGDAYLISLSSFWMLVRAMEFGGEMAFVDNLSYVNELIEQSVKTRDNLLLGLASILMAEGMGAMLTVEENPDKMREGYSYLLRYAEDALQHFEVVSSYSNSAEACMLMAESYIDMAREVETSLEQKTVLLEKAVEFGRKGLEYAERSGPNDISTNLHALSKGLYFLSVMKQDLEEKKRFLEEALKLRERSITVTEQTAVPFDYWNRGVYQNYLALIRAEQAEIESDSDRKRELVEEAVSVMESCLQLCKKGLIVQPQSKVGDVLFSLIPFGWYQGWFGDILEKLYLLTGEEKILEKAIAAYKGVVETYTQIGFPSRVAEAHWKIAKLYDRLVSYQESADHFESASNHYNASAEGMPNLKEFYMDYASYMQAWAEIERARFSSTGEEYDKAQKHYEKAANLFELFKAWKYLAPNYSAWSLLQQAEDQSRKNHGKEAIETLEKAAQLFDKAKSSLKAQVTKIRSAEEKDMALTTIKASQIRSEYCQGRIALEEAQMLGKEGDTMSSSRKYLAASHIFEKLQKETESETEREELELIAYLCLAWQKMTLAETRASPELYMEASQLFEQTSELSGSERTRLLMLGHSRFCKALEAGTRFMDTRDTALHSAAMQHLQSATSYYQKAGFQKVAEYAGATGLLFDAYVYMDNAKKEIDPERKARLYMMSEKILETSAGAYLKAEQPAKMEEVRGLLTKVREEKELAVSLTEILHASTIVSTTPAFSTPVKNEEIAVGLEKFKHALIETNLVLSSKEAKAGEGFNLEIQIMNVGKETALLAKVEEILPTGIELVAQPDYCRFEDAHLDMKGKRLDPLRTETVRLVLRSFEKGIFTVKPRIVYVDETGRQMSCEPEPVTISVSKVVLPGRITTGYEDLDTLLLGGIPENYSVILVSPSCDERDFLVKKFLEAGVKEGTITFYVTIETTGMRTLAEEFQSNFYLFICNPQADETIRSLPNVFKLKGVENLTDISIALTSAFRRWDSSTKDPKRACIEIISDVLLQHHAVISRRWLTGLLTDLKAKAFTTLAVINAQMHPPDEVQAILGLFEGEIGLYEKESEVGLGKFLKIRRMHNQRYSTTELPLRRARLETLKE